MLNLTFPYLHLKTRCHVHKGQVPTSLRESTPKETRKVVFTGPFTTKSSPSPLGPDPKIFLP